MATENKEKAKGEAIFPLTQEQINQIAAIGAKEGVRAYKEEQKKAIDGYTFPNDTTCRYECTLAESELAGKEISEIGLYDTNGDIVCIKTFTRKGKDDDVEQTYVLDDIF